MIFYYFCASIKTVGSWTVFTADMNSAYKNTLVSVKINKYTVTRVFYACRIHICEENSGKSYSFHENAKIIENHWFLLIFWGFHWNSWADCCKKS